MEILPFDERSDKVTLQSHTYRDGRAFTEHRQACREIHSLFGSQLEGEKSLGSLSLCASDWGPQSEEMSTLSSTALYASETIQSISQEEIQTSLSPRTFLEKGVYLL